MLDSASSPSQMRPWAMQESMDEIFQRLKTMWEAENLTWKLRMQRAEETGHFTESDKQLSHSWVFCALGEKKEAEHWLTLNTEHQVLGSKFYTAVKHDRVSEARRFYDEIQKIDWKPPQ